MLLAFVTAAAVLWTSVFGYVAVLLVLAMRRRTLRPGGADGASATELPAIAIVVPVRNEERFIAAKLADLRGTNYPADRLMTVVVDGGSTDATASIVETERAANSRLTLVRVDNARGKAAQLNAVLPTL